MRWALRRQRQAETHQRLLGLPAIHQEFGRHGLHRGVECQQVVAVADEDGGAVGDAGRRDRSHAESASARAHIGDHQIALRQRGGIGRAGQFERNRPRLSALQGHAETFGFKRGQADDGDALSIERLHDGVGDGGIEGFAAAC